MTHYQKLYTLLSATSSTATSGPIFVGDAQSLACSLVTTAASVVTLQGSNDDGFGAALATWSTLTALTANGAYAIQPGVRWMRAQQAASSSSATLRVSKTVAH
jgi:hypothetical protein